MYGLLPRESVLIFLAFLLLSNSGLHPNIVNGVLSGTRSLFPCFSVALRVLAGRAPGSAPGRLSGLQRTAAQACLRSCKPVSVTSTQGSGSVQDLRQAHACKIGHPSLPLVFLRFPYALEILAALILAATKMAGLLTGSLPPGAARIMPPLAKATQRSRNSSSWVAGSSFPFFLKSACFCSVSRGLRHLSFVSHPEFVAGTLIQSSSQGDLLVKGGLLSPPPETETSPKLPLSLLLLSS